jgi:dTDP-L-rhamnose 4-epimerase
VAKVLITGGAGFVGCHLARALVDSHEVVALDSLLAQVHGRGQRRPARLHPAVRLVVGDVRDPDAVSPLIEGADVVVHLAASTGMGQSMYRICDYVEVNITGTAVVLEAVRAARHAPGRLVVASSRAVYGEGRYLCPECGPVVPNGRTAGALEKGSWEPPCPSCGGVCSPAPTPEVSPPAPASVYAVSKLAQEQLVLTVAAASGIEAVALRLFNVYGPGQSAHNPYTGVINAFLARSLNGVAADVYEDGEATRDFVHVDDVALALKRAVTEGLAKPVVNVGTGRAMTLLATARAVADALGAPPPLVSGRYRIGDVRHSRAGVSSASELGVAAQVNAEDGLQRLAAEVAGQRWSDETQRVEVELVSEGLGGTARRR